MILLAPMILIYIHAPWWCWVAYAIEVVHQVGFYIWKSRTNEVVKAMMKDLTMLINGTPKKSQ